MDSKENQDVHWTSLRSSLVDLKLSPAGSMLTNPRNGQELERCSFRENTPNTFNFSEKKRSALNPMAPSSVYSSLDSSSHSNMKSCYRTPPVATNIDLDDVQARLLKLQIETGYEIIQRHGQRIFGGPPPGWEGELPGRGTEIYCYKIPRDCFEDELVPLFSKIGPIYELRLMVEFSGTNRTFCYVRYTKKEHALEAIGSLDGHEIRRGQHLAVTKSVDNRRLWINGIPKNRTADEFKEELGLITCGISNVILYPSQTEANRSRSYMFVEYESHRAAALARRKLVPGKVFLFGIEVGQVEWAAPEPEVDELQMRHVKVLYVRHLNMATSEETLWSYFQELSGGQVERLKKPKDYAFVHFTTRESAELTLKKCDHLEIDGQKVEVLWAKPPDRDHVAKKLDRQICRGPAPASITQNWSPAQILDAVCESHQWGEPDYTINCARDPSSGIPLYHYRVSIPGYPAIFPDNVFQAQTWMMTEIAAKTVAAKHTLSQLKLGSTHIPSMTRSAYPLYQPLASTANSFNHPLDSPFHSLNHPRSEATETWAQVFPQFATTSGRIQKMDTWDTYTADNFNT